MESAEKKVLKRTGFTAVFWVIIALLAMGGATFAWFSFTAYTNVTPMAGAVGHGGIVLTISDSYGGPFGESTELHPEGATENLQPVSTNNLTNWFASAGNNSSGISDKFVDVTENINEMTMYGQIFLQCEGGECDVFFNPDQLAFGDNPQLIAASRLGLKIKSNADGEKTIIFKLDSAGNTSGAESQETMSDSNVVITGVDASGNAETTTDPAEDFTSYSATVNGDSITRGEKILLHLGDGEIATVDYVLYMEGCDENSINVAQDNGITMQLGFAGTEEQ